MDKKRPLPSMIHQDNFLVSCLVRRQLAGDRPLAGQHVNKKVPYGAWWPWSTPTRFFLLRLRGGRGDEDLERAWALLLGSWCRAGG